MTVSDNAGFFGDTVIFAQIEAVPDTTCIGVGVVRGSVFEVGTLIVGNGGFGRFFATGETFATIRDTMLVGSFGRGEVVVSGGASMATGKMLVLGEAGFGDLYVDSSGFVASSGVVVGQSEDFEGTLTIRGAEARMEIVNNLTAG